MPRPCTARKQSGIQLLPFMMPTIITSSGRKAIPWGDRTNWEQNWKNTRTPNTKARSTDAGRRTTIMKNSLKGKNLLLIQVRSLNNFPIGLKVKVGDGFVEVTPNLNELVGKSVYLNNYYTTVGIGSTSDAEFTVLTGIYPRIIIIRFLNMRTSNTRRFRNSFRERLQNFLRPCPNTGEFYNRNKNSSGALRLWLSCGGRATGNFGRGFDPYLDERRGLSWRMWLTSSKRESEAGPVFGFAITISCHMPYEHPEERKDEATLFPGKENLFPDNFTLTKNFNLNEQLVGYLGARITPITRSGRHSLILKKAGFPKTRSLCSTATMAAALMPQMFYDYPHLFENSINNNIEFLKERYHAKTWGRRMLSGSPFHHLWSFRRKPRHPSSSNNFTGQGPFDSVERTLATLFGL